MITKNSSQHIITYHVHIYRHTLPDISLNNQHPHYIHVYSSSAAKHMQPSPSVEYMRVGTPQPMLSMHEAWDHPLHTKVIAPLRISHVGRSDGVCVMKRLRSEQASK